MSLRHLSHVRLHRPPLVVIVCTIIAVGTAGFTGIRSLSPDRAAAAADTRSAAPVSAYLAARPSPRGMALPAPAPAAPTDPAAAFFKTAPLYFAGAGSDRERALDCLSAAAWYEAGDDRTGQRSVVQVVLNRLRHPSFPKSVCGVVFQGSERRTGCQFTFSCDGSLGRRRPSAAAWGRARAVAQEALDGSVDEAVHQATHYHADYVVPWWSAKLTKLAKVGAHIFYAWPGNRGALLDLHSYSSELQVSLPAKLIPPGQAAPHGGAAAQILAETAPLIAMPEAPTTATKLSGAISASPPLPMDEAIMLRVDPAGASGRWAVDALGRCSGRTSCDVLGYETAEQIDLNRSRSAETRDRPLFLFVKDKVSGMNVALWDCSRIQRPSPAQCLPGEGPALRRLLRRKNDRAAS